MTLFDTPHAVHSVATSANLLADMRLDAFLGSFFENPEKYLTCSPETIRQRNKICAALLDRERLQAALEAFYHAAAPMRQGGRHADTDPIRLMSSIMSVRRFYDAALALVQAINGAIGLPAAFGAVAAELEVLLKEEYPANFDMAWQAFAAGVETPGSAAYQISFSEDLRLTDIALTAIQKESYGERTLLSRLSKASNPMLLDSMLALTPGAYDERSLRHAGAKFTDIATQLRFAKTTNDMLTAQSAIFMGQIAALERRVMGKIGGLLGELPFVLGLYRCAKALGGAFAQVARMEKRAMTITDMVHPALPNAVPTSVPAGGDIMLLGGANQSGKTTFLRTLGAVQILFQLGLPVPAAYAEISPASGIFALFPREEDEALNEGKLGCELKALGGVMAVLDEHSLFLGNEPITGTSPAENLLLSREALCILKAKGARGVWVSHLTDIFSDAKKLNDMPFGSRYVVMAAKVVDGRFLVEG